MTRTERTRAFYHSLPVRSRLALDAGIFCLFATLGAAIDILVIADQRHITTALMVAMSGGCAVLYARAGFTGRTLRYMGAGFAVQFTMLWMVVAMKQAPKVITELTPAELTALYDKQRLNVTLITVFLTAGYSLMVAVFTRQGAKYFATRAEIAIAQRIHQRLVPRVHGSEAGITWAGLSRASSDIGGDLVDVLRRGPEVIGCVADVSGHGVGAGLLMGMFKAALHAAAAETTEPSAILSRIHRTLAPMTDANMYVTAAIVRVRGRALDFAGAGHPAMLVHRRAHGRVESYPSSGPAVALLDDFACRSHALTLDEGDTVLLLTDGILEALDDGDRDAGSAAVSRVLSAGASVPIDALLAQVLAVGDAAVRDDDQTALLLRAIR